LLRTNISAIRTRVGARNIRLLPPATMAIHLHKLNFDTDYEVVVSYPATIPVKFTLDITLLEASDAHTDSNLDCDLHQWHQLNHQHGSFRHLLDTEKTRLQAFSNDQRPTQNAILQISVHPIGVLPFGMVHSEVVFNVILEPLLFGLASRVWRLIGFAVPVLGAVLCFITPIMGNLLRASSLKGQ